MQKKEVLVKYTIFYATGLKNQIFNFAFVILVKKGAFMVVYSEPFDKKILLELQTHYFGDMVKGVVDVAEKKIALDAEMHADLETLLLESGSRQENLWGFNFYPEMDGEDFLEFDSLINIRPNQGNRSRGVEDPGIRNTIAEIIYSLCK